MFGLLGLLAAAGGAVYAYPAASLWWRVQSLPPAAAGPVSYEADVMPILEEHCYACHGDGRKKGGLNFDSRATLVTGGQSGEVIREGDSAGSLLIHRLAGLTGAGPMPPSNKAPLTATQIAVLRAWIDGGLVWEASGS